MTVVLEAARPLQTIPHRGVSADAADALEEIIAAHRAALVALAPHQEERAARVETGWHMERLGVLLCQRDAPLHAQNPAPGGVPDPERGRESDEHDHSRT